MSTLRPGRPPSRSPLIAAGLGIAVMVTAVLAYQAVDASRSHREVVEKTLAEHARTAAWQFIGESQRYLDAKMIHPGLEVAAFAGGKEPDVDFGDPEAVAQRNLDKAWCWPECVEALFRLDMVDSTVTWVNPGEGPAGVLRNLGTLDAVQPWMLEAVGRGKAAMGERWGYATAVHGELLAAWRWYDGPDGEAMVYGFLAPSRVLTPLFAEVFEDSPLLPPSLLAGRPNGQVVVLEVRDPSGRVLASFDGGAPSGFEASLPYDPAFAGMEARARIRSDAASSLVIGGLPASRLPLILGLMALTVGLLGASIVVIRREGELARLRSDFVSGVSHELRTPLAQIRLFSETLHLGRIRDESERARSLEVLVSESRRLTHLVENVLLFSKSQREGLKLKLERTDLSELVASVCEGFAPLAQRAGQSLDTDVEARVEATVDGNAVRQALLNLLDNAVKYGPSGQGVAVSLRRDDLDHEVVLTVGDRGPGIPRGQRDTIFEPYFRLPHDRDSATAGSGIGLSVVRQVASGHGGRVTVEDRADGGTRFELRLPLALPDRARG